MDVRLYDTATDFGPVAHWVYRRDPVLFTGELTALRSTRGVTDGVFLSVDDCDGAVGAALQLPGDALLVSGLPPAMAKAAAVEVSAVRAALPGIRGTRGTAMAFADAWCSVTGAHAAEAIGRTLYGLDELVPPTGVPGASRIAGAADAELLFDWLDGFFVDAFDAASDREARRGYLADIRADGGHVVLWSVVGGRCAGQHGAGARTRGGHVPHRPGLHAGREQRSRVRRGGHRGRRASRPPARRQARGAVRRRRQPWREPDLPAARVRAGRRFPGVRVHGLTPPRTT